MEERRPRERELVLAPNEYAWVLDTTKGHINCYVGPNKTSLAQTDQLVMFDEREKRFVNAEMQQAVQLYATAPENWYVILKNPAVDGHHPRAGVASGLSELRVGKKVVLPGPCSFALWPGQMARVVEAHRLQSNQYLIARIYDAALAEEDPARVLARDLGDDEVVNFEVGQRLVIPGTRCAFYMPPNGVEVVPDDNGALVRDAVTLQRLEYCVLERENGTKRTVRGEAVVFPAPDEHFKESGGRRRFRAIELSETTGIHVKVVAPYEETEKDADGKAIQRVEGEELFITGSKSRLYFPRDEHAIIRTAGGGEVHHAVAIPAGEGALCPQPPHGGGGPDRRAADVPLRSPRSGDDPPCPRGSGVFAPVPGQPGGPSLQPRGAGAGGRSRPRWSQPLPPPGAATSTRVRRTVGWRSSRGVSTNPPPSSSTPNTTAPSPSTSGVAMPSASRTSRGLAASSPAPRR